METKKEPDHSDLIGKLCAYCQKEIMAGQEITICYCDKLYHHNCWEDNEGCIEFGCGDTSKTIVTLPKETEPKDKPEKPAAKAATKAALVKSESTKEDKEYKDTLISTTKITRPPTPKEIQPSAPKTTTKSCPHCDKEIPDDSTFCRYCGEKIKPSPRPAKPQLDKLITFIQKRKTPLIWLTALLLLAIAIGTIILTKTPPPPTKKLKVLRGHEDDVDDIAFSPSGKYLASGGDDNTVILWDVHSGKKLKVLRGHKDWVLAIAFSPDGKYLASGSKDHNVILWGPK